VAVIPEITTDLFGAVSPVATEDGAEVGVFKNVDGERRNETHLQQYQHQQRSATCP
jgi:hypothetical protein